jgi:hypothetical protein
MRLPLCSPAEHPRSALRCNLLAFTVCLRLRRPAVSADFFFAIGRRSQTFLSTTDYLSDAVLWAARKGIDVIQVRNFLHIVMLAEPGWVGCGSSQATCTYAVPIRFFLQALAWQVLEVSGEPAGSRSYKQSQRVALAHSRKSGIDEQRLSGLVAHKISAT